MEETHCHTSNKGGLALKSKRQKTIRKLQKLRFRRTFNQNRTRGSSNKSHDLSSMYDVKLAKLRSNNRSLAKALASQKIETQQWYNEVISLKAELQEAQEQLLRYNDSDAESFILQEVEQRLREQCESFNGVINESMQNVLVVVESLTKLKKLVAGSMKNHRSSSASRKSSAFSLPRSSGSRLPLAPTGSSSSPRQSVVRPMVGGLVLQPARVAIPKLDMTRRRRLQERREACQDMGMSVIGEQSINQEEENSSRNESQILSETDLDVSNRTEEEENSELENVSHAEESISQQDSSVDQDIATADEPENTSRQKSSATTTASPRGRGRGRGKGRGKGRRARDMSEVENSPTVTPKKDANSSVEVENDSPNGKPDVAPKSEAQEEEDPLEGPSWLYADFGASRRSRGRGRGRSRGRGRARGTAKRSSGINLGLESSSESECDELSSSSSKVSPKGLDVSHQANNKSVCASLEVSSPPSLTLDHSYLASPASMLARLESLEAKAGRRSKARSRGSSLRTSMDEISRTSIVGIEGQRRLTRRKTELARKSLETDDIDCVNDTFHLELEESVLDDDTRTELLVDDSILMPPPSLPLPVQNKDYLITDNDLTCIGDMSMDMTEPISKVISQAVLELSKTDETKMTEKRFFKSQSPDLPVSPKTGEKTPFDLSLMDATVVNIPPYSSRRSLEKENLPPDLGCENDLEPLNLRRVSIVLEDVMKCPDLPEIYTPDLKLSLSPETVKSANLSSGRRKNALPKESKGESPLIKKPKKRKTLRFSAVCDEDEDVDAEDDEDFCPKGRKSQRGRRKTASVGMTRPKRSMQCKKRTSIVDNVSPEPLKKQRKRRKDSEGNTPLTTPDTSVLCELDEELQSEPSKINSEKEGMTKITLPVQDDKNVNLSGCYVMVHRTPEKIVQQTVQQSVIKDCTGLNAACNTGPESPFKDENVMVMVNLSKQMEMVMKKAQQMKVEQDYIEGSENLEEIVDCSEAPKEAKIEGFNSDETERCGSLVESSSGLDDRVENDAKEKEEKLRQELILEEDGAKELQEEPKQETEEPRRRRGAAMKIASFKEPSLSIKMRRSESNTKAKPKGRQASRSSTS